MVMQAVLRVQEVVLVQCTRARVQYSCRVLVQYTRARVQYSRGALLQCTCTRTQCELTTDTFLQIKPVLPDKGGAKPAKHDVQQQD